MAREGGIVEGEGKGCGGRGMCMQGEGLKWGRSPSHQRDATGTSSSSAHRNYAGNLPRFLQVIVCCF